MNWLSFFGGFVAGVFVMALAIVVVILNVNGENRRPGYINHNKEKQSWRKQW